MIHITQGFEHGIGIEVFLKCLPLFDQSKLNQIIYYGDLKSLEVVCKSLKVKFNLSLETLQIYNREIKLHLIQSKKYSQTLTSILTAIEYLKPEDVLFTLPSSKTQFKYNNVEYLGHTEFLRSYFQNNDLGMFFNSPNINLLLLTDHLPLNNVIESLKNFNLIQNKILSTINHAKKYLNIKFENLYFMGINPHAGEKGILGNEEILLAKKLKKAGIKVKFLPGDSIINQNIGSKDLVISTYHDQGLTYFKTINQFIGANITTGLHFNRISVDHGTAEALFGKNQANPQGCYYCLDLVL